MKNLSTIEGRLLAFMRDKGLDKDVTIYDMHDCIMMQTGAQLPYEDFDANIRHAQKYVGAFVSRINRKQGEYEIVPGELKRTYRVQFKSKE